MAKLVPTNDRLVVRPKKEEDTTSFGIVLPKSGGEKPEEGEVIAVGPGKMKEDGTRAAMDIKVGDKVIFKKYAPDEFEMDGEKVLVLSESDVLAKVE